MPPSSELIISMKMFWSKDASKTPPGRDNLRCVVKVSLSMFVESKIILLFALVHRVDICHEPSPLLTHLYIMCDDEMWSNWDVNALLTKTSIYFWHHEKIIVPGAPSVNTMANSPRRGEDSRGRVRVLVMIRGHKTPTSGPLEQTMDTLCTSLSISPVIISTEWTSQIYLCVKLQWLEVI